LTRCVKCGKEFPGEYSYCPNCGAEQTPVAAAAATAPKKGRRGFLKAGIAAIALILLGFLGWHQYGEDLKDWLKRVLGGEPTTTTTTTKPPTTMATTTPTTTTTTLTTATPTTTATATTTTTEETPTLVWPMNKPEPPRRDWLKMVNPYLKAGGQGDLGEAMIAALNLGDAFSYCATIDLYLAPDPGAPEDHLQARLKDCALAIRWSGQAVPPGGRLDFYITDKINARDWPDKFKEELRRAYTGLNFVDVIYLPAAFKEGLPNHVVVVYDPLLDPRGFRMDGDAQLKTLFRRGTDRDRHIMVYSPWGRVEA